MRQEAEIGENTHILTPRQNECFEHMLKHIGFYFAHIMDKKVTQIPSLFLSTILIFADQ
jgi:hypothetical protein